MNNIPQNTRWKNRFAFLFRPLAFDYDKQAWRNDALQPRQQKDTPWDDFQPSDFRKLRFPMAKGFYDSPWVQFHPAALHQRYTVLENLL